MNPPCGGVWMVLQVLYCVWRSDGQARHGFVVGSLVHDPGVFEKEVTVGVDMHRPDENGRVLRRPQVIDRGLAAEADRAAGVNPRGYRQLWLLRGLSLSARGEAATPVPDRDDCE